jgi:hypothetical protein
MSQTTYALRTAVGIPGELSCPVQSAVLDSKINALAMPAGIFVVYDTLPDAVRVPATTGEVTGALGCGFVKKDIAIERQQGQTLDYPAKSGVTVMRRGRMFVTCESDCALGGDVFVRFAAGTGTQLGAVRKDADTATAVKLPGAKFLRALAAGGLTEIEYDAQNP